MSFKAILSYDGTHYFGWQKTKTGPSIQEELEKAIFRIANETSLPEAASRTDRGVHAEGQRLQRGLNAVLPPDIRILSLESSPADFHPTLQASAKEYHYRLSIGPVYDPMQRGYAWHVPYSLELNTMAKASHDLLGNKTLPLLPTNRKKIPIVFSKKSKSNC